MNSLGALVVTFNRLEKLKKALAAYGRQETKPDFVLVVDNHSTDGTGAFLEEWKAAPSSYQKYVLTLPENVGGSGGFARGMRYAFEHLSFDWLWLADDDAYPEGKAFSILSKEISRSKNRDIFCGSVYEHDKLSLDHRRKKKLRSWQVIPFPEEDYKQDCFQVDIFSFVGVVFPREVLAKEGYPREDFFIWYDDTEYSLRCKKDGFQCFCLPKMKIDHDVSRPKTPNSVSWKDFYGYRNLLEIVRLYDNPRSLFLLETRYRLSFVKWFFLDRKRYQVKKDSLRAFRKGAFGKNPKYLP